MSSHYAGWALHPKIRQRLLEMCPPMHEVVRCEHVTMCLVHSNAPPPPDAEIIVRGMYYDEACQALVVQVNGAVQRSDGTLFHVTMSHVPSFPSKMVGQRMALFPDRVSQIAIYPLGRVAPFVRRLGA